MPEDAAKRNPKAPKTGKKAAWVPPSMHSSGSMVVFIPSLPLLIKSAECKGVNSLLCPIVHTYIGVVEYIL